MPTVQAYKSYKFPSYVFATPQLNLTMARDIIAWSHVYGNTFSVCFGVIYRGLFSRRRHIWGLCRYLPPVGEISGEARSTKSPARWPGFRFLVAIGYDITVLLACGLLVCEVVHNFDYCPDYGC